MIPFYKMSGCGNDFIIIDNRERILEEKKLKLLVRGICHRRMSVGADGVILIEKSDTSDFKWRFFNSNGSTAQMCGNGARCIARYAQLTGISTCQVRFETEAGILHAEVAGNRVKISLPDPIDLQMDKVLSLNQTQCNVCSVNTGVPHVVIMADQIEDTPVVPLGREIRHHLDYAPEGTNVNFITMQPDGSILNRTYERGVEDETLACGTGVVAGAIVLSKKFGLASPICVTTRSGESLTVYFKHENGKYSELFLEGNARMICQGEIPEESWNWICR